MTSRTEWSTRMRLRRLFSAILDRFALGEYAGRTRHLTDNTFDFSSDPLEHCQVGSGDFDSDWCFDSSGQHVDARVKPEQPDKVAKALVLEVFGRRGILLPEMNGWEGHVEGKALVVSGPMNAASVVNLLSLFSNGPSADTTPGEGSTFYVELPLEARIAEPELER